MASPIRPPFTEETARAKVQAAEDAWDTGDPEVGAQAYAEDSRCPAAINPAQELAAGSAMRVIANGYE